MTPQGTLIVEGLWKQYSGAWAVQGLNLHVGAGDIVGLIGPNGAGKTTTLKAIVGLLQPDAGRIAIDGRPLADDPVRYRASLGYMPETFTLPDYLSGGEFLEYLGRLRGIPYGALQEKMRDGLARFDLWDRRRDLILSYSKGMRQKVAFLAATLHDPRVVLLDEPLIGIDPVGQVRLREVVHTLKSRGSGVLVSTHMLDTAERLCNRIAIVHRGRTVAEGTLAQLREVAQTRADSTLEEVFLQLTAEAQTLPPPEQPRRRRLGWWGR